MTKGELFNELSGIVAIKSGISPEQLQEIASKDDYTFDPEEASKIIDSAKKLYTRNQALADTGIRNSVMAGTFDGLEKSFKQLVLSMPNNKVSEEVVENIFSDPENKKSIAKFTKYLSAHNAAFAQEVGKLTNKATSNDETRSALEKAQNSIKQRDEALADWEQKYNQALDQMRVKDIKREINSRLVGKKFSGADDYTVRLQRQEVINQIMSEAHIKIEEDGKATLWNKNQTDLPFFNADQSKVLELDDLIEQKFKPFAAANVVKKQERESLVPGLNIPKSKLENRSEHFTEALKANLSAHKK